MRSFQRSNRAGVRAPRDAVRWGACAAPRRGVAACGVAATTSSIASVETLRSVLGDKGCSVEGVSVVEDMATGRPTLVAAKDFKAGESLLQISDSAFISPESLKQHPLGPKVAALDNWLQVALVLVAERFGTACGNKQMSAYVQSLPSTLDSPLFWSEEDLALIQGTQMLSSAEMYRSFFASQFEELQQEVFALDPAVFPASVFTLENFLWAVSIVRSRVHAPLEGDSLAVVPLADSVSHSRLGNVAWESKSAGLFGRGKVLAVEATKPLKMGETLTMDFGVNKPDNDVMLDCGVIDEPNAKGGYTLSLSIAEDDPNLDDKLDILEMQGLSGSASFNLSPGMDPPTQMLAYLRLSQVSGADTFLLESIFREDAWGFMCEPVSEENETAICEAMSGGASAALKQYSSSIDEDLQLLRGGTVAKGSNAEAALLIRLGEKEALESMVQFFDQRQALMPTLEFYQERRLKRLGLLDSNGDPKDWDSMLDGIA